MQSALVHIVPRVLADRHPRLSTSTCRRICPANPPETATGSNPQHTQGHRTIALARENADRAGAHGPGSRHIREHHAHPAIPPARPRPTCGCFREAA